QIRQRRPERDVHAHAPVDRPPVPLQHRPQRPLAQLEPSEEHGRSGDGQDCRFMKPETKPPKSAPMAPTPTPRAAMIPTILPTSTGAAGFAATPVSAA